MSNRSLLSCRIVVLLSGTRGTCYIAREVPGIGLAEAILEQAIRLARHMQLSTPHWCGTLCLSSAYSYQVEGPKKQQAACAREKRAGPAVIFEFLQICALASSSACAGSEQAVEPCRGTMNSYPCSLLHHQTLCTCDSEVWRRVFSLPAVPHLH